MKKLILALAINLSIVSGVCQANESSWFGGYELFEMVSNDFDNFAGEIGYGKHGKNAIRLTIMEVDLKERHLSNKYMAYAVDGDNVKGYLRGYEINYDLFFTPNWYYSLNIGYYNDVYKHTILDEKIDNHTATVGFGVGYRHQNLFDLDGVYLNFNMPFRYYFNHIEETKMGDTTIRPHIFVNNIWLFIGYEF